MREIAERQHLEPTLLDIDNINTRLRVARMKGLVKAVKVKEEVWSPPMLLPVDKNRPGRPSGVSRRFRYELTEQGLRYAHLVLDGGWFCDECDSSVEVEKKPTCKRCGHPARRTL